MRGNKEPLKVVMQGHFRALVLQFPQGEGIKVGKDDASEDWLDIVATLKSIIWYESLDELHKQEAAYAYFQLACYQRNYCQKFMDSSSKKGGLSKGENKILQRSTDFSVTDD
ncbi:hypothetical protein K1719_026607 [Acacia pycnantha]|nr:hypothetical protein K1719_026607 [Acacia pycnantha]